MNSAALATVITIAVAVFIGQLLYKRVFEPAFATQVKEEAQAPDYRNPVDRFLDNY